MDDTPQSVDWIVRGIAVAGLAILSAAVFLAFEVLGEIRSDIARVETTVSLAAEPEEIVAYAQLSSATSQGVPDGALFAEVRMELRDAVEGMSFDPRRDDSHLKVQTQGAYFLIAVPQTKFGSDCTRVWLAIGDTDVANSNIEVCLQEGTTTGVSQGVVCLVPGDLVSVRMSGAGIEASQPEDEPLVPALIFSAVRLGNC